MTLEPDETRTVPLAAPAVGDREKAAVADVLDSGQLAQGPAVEAFEAKFAAFCDTDYAIGTANGTTALHAALAGLGIGDGDVVLTTPFSFAATANAIRFTGAEPAFADIHPATYTLDPEAVEAAIRARDGAVDAILAVHLYGLPAPMDRLTEIGDAYDVPVIEDAAQAHGARHRGRPVGSIGDVGCFSFYPTKNMTTGEGGMVVTDRPGLADRVRRFVDHGRGADGRHVRLGHNFRLSDVAAAIGRVQLERLPTAVETRRDNAAVLTRRLAELSVEPPTEPDGRSHAYNQYTIRSPERDALADHLTEFGIDTGVYYPRPIPAEPAYGDVTCETPVASRAAAEVLSLPVHPQLERADLDAIVTAIEYFDTYGA